AQLKTLAHASHTLDEMLNRAPNRHAPYVGESAFATKAGIHASAIMKEPATYEHVPPESVGNRRKLLVSDQAGKSNVLAELERIGLKIDKDDPRIGRLLDVVKEREAIGYAYEGADASFELLARRVFGKVPSYFDVEKFDVTVEQRDNAVGQRVTVSLAVVKVKVDGEHLISAAEGNGPVNALDLALRKDLGKYQSYISGLELTDYRVRILNGGTEAITPALIESQDETGERWTTVGVSPHHRCLVSGAHGFDHLQARALRRANVIAPQRCLGRARRDAGSLHEAMSFSISLRSMLVTHVTSGTQ